MLADGGAVVKHTLTIRVVLPWWWRLYLGAVLFSHSCGVIDADPSVVARFLARHIKLRADRP
jgi:hypothetical protein